MKTKIPNHSLKTLVNGELIDHVFVGDFDTQYKNKYSNSMFNNQFNLPDEFCQSKANANLGQYLSDLVTTVARRNIGLRN